jgi:hypothetical protein
MYVDLHQTSPVPSSVTFWLGQPHQIQKYITALKLQLDKIQASAGSLYLQSNRDDHAAETLNSDVTTVMLLAGKSCAQSARFPVSPLHEAQTNQRIL